MRNLSRFGVVGALGFTVSILSGCAGVRWPWDPPIPPGCEATYIKGSEWDVGGVKLPINAYGLGTVEVAKVKYTGPEAQKLSDSVAAIDQGRRGLCTVVGSKAFETMSERYRAEKFDAVLAINKLIVSYGIELSNAKTVAEGLALANDAKERAKQINLESAPPNSQVGPPSVPVAGVVDELARQQVANLQTDVKGLTEGLKALTDAGQIRLHVKRFEPDGAALFAEQRLALANDFRNALARIPAGRTPTVLLIGYADGKGAQTYNVSLALRRAEAVAQFLRRQDFGREFHTEVTSGGIFSNGPDDQARRVEIVVSRATTPAALV